jgi:hypothetical protein
LTPAQEAVRHFRAPVDNCGAAPALPAASPEAYATFTREQVNAARPAFAKEQQWQACRSNWMARYAAALNTLGTPLAAPGELPVAALSSHGGRSLVAPYENAMKDDAATQAQWTAHMRAFQAAANGAK